MKAHLTVFHPDTGEDYITYHIVLCGHFRICELNYLMRKHLFQSGFIFYIPNVKAKIHCKDICQKTWKMQFFSTQKKMNLLNYKYDIEKNVLNINGAFLVKVRNISYEKEAPNR